MHKIHKINKIQKEQVIGEMAAEALCMEAAVTPKPGLVDRKNSGAHKDMDYPLFLVSADALKPYFTECARLGMTCGICSHCDEASYQEACISCSCCRSSDDRDIHVQAGILRRMGIEAEHQMFEATGGVNTHKGMIFSMGILCFCLGMHSEKLVFCGAERSEPDMTICRLQNSCRYVASVLLGENKKLSYETHGEEVMRRTGIRGIREEALSGFNSAFSLGYSVLKRARSMGLSPNHSMVYTLLYLMTEVEDSNAIYRGGTEGLAFLQKEAAALVRNSQLPEESWFDKVRELDRKCIERNLSAGGCADMLAMSIMLYMIFEDYQWLLNQDKGGCRE